MHSFCMMHFNELFFKMLLFFVVVHVQNIFPHQKHVASFASGAKNV